MRHGVRGCRDGGVAERHEAEQGRSEDGVRTQVGWGGQRRGETVRWQQAQQACGSGAASARAAAFKCLRPRREGRASGEEREEREREWREKTQGQPFDLAQTHDFQQELEKF